MHSLILVFQVARALAREPELVDAGKLVKGLQVELRYATKDNFMGENMYGDLRACYLHRDAAAMLSDAQDYLVRVHPELRLHVYDCARPASVQWRMWGRVKGTASQKYVANPARGSIHSYGCAVDLTVAREDGTPLDMGTPYDFFGERAHPALEIGMLESGELTGEQVANRLILREAMLRAGFRLLPHEWWHFDCASQTETRKRYKLIP